MIKTFEQFNADDPYGEEIWEDENLILIDWNSIIEIGDEIYAKFNPLGEITYLGEVIDIIDRKIHSLSGEPNQLKKEYILRVDNKKREMDIAELIRYKAKMKKI